jgi:hypothetical protein
MPDILVSQGLNVPLTGAAPGSPAALANDRVQQVMNAHNKRGRRPLTPFEAKQLAEGELNPTYIYNVSPIHIWSRPQGQLGTIVIPKRKWDAAVSIPVSIKGAIVRWYKSGLGAEQPFIEGGDQIVEDVCGFGPSYGSRSENANLSRYGVFSSPKPFDAVYLPEAKQAMLRTASDKEAKRLLEEFLVPKAQQKEMLHEATQKLLADLQSRILEADNWYMGGAASRKYLEHCDWSRECLKAFNHITGKKEAKPWAGIMVDEALESCVFCGNMNKPNLIVCPNCKNTLDPVAFAKAQDELKAKAAKKGAEKEE